MPQVLKFRRVHSFSTANGLSILYSNCRSMAPKIVLLHAKAALSKPDVIALTETRLDSTIMLSEINISLYRLICRDRTRHGGGGVPSINL